MDSKPYTIRYEFDFHNGTREEFVVNLDPVKIAIIWESEPEKPDWTKLENSKCDCCTLDDESTIFCPVAVSIAELVEKFKDSKSFEQCTTTCIDPERTYIKKSSSRQDLYSIMGLLMATSGCPTLSFFKPMARFHLPFSTISETVVRSASMYLLGQFFEHKKGNRPDLDLDKLDEHYARVQIVNTGILSRIESVVKQDADNNAIIILNALAQMLSLEIEEQLSSYEYLFDK